MRARAPSTRRWALAGAGFLAAALAGSLALLGDGRPTSPPARAERPPDVAAAAPAPVPASVAPAAPAPAEPATASGVPEVPASEDALIERLRDEVDVRPAVALRLAQDAAARFPEGRHAEERAYLEMRALVHLDDIVAARDAAERFFAQHPRSPLGRDVFRLTGMRPRPSPLPPG